jgi:hypothetical protein
MAGDPWSRQEVEAVVRDYLDMLALELVGKTFVKRARNEALRMTALKARSHGSVEFKHQNISAVLGELGYPCVKGYKPRGNVQGLLREVLHEQLPRIDQLVDADVLAPQPEVEVANVLDILVEPPSVAITELQDERGEYRLPNKPAEPARPINYLLREALNRSLGTAGETLVMKYEHARLSAAGKDHLAGKVEQVSVTKGDRAGYDIHSYETSGHDRLIEVKTTRYGRYTPFYISAGELRFCDENADAYQLYRLFEFSEAPQLFTLPGEVGHHVKLDPMHYLASF